MNINWRLNTVHACRRTVNDPQDLIKVTTDCSGVLNHGPNNVLRINDEDGADLRRKSESSDS